MDLKQEIELLKTKKNALILAHYYQRPDIQEIADYVGDSYYLSKIVKNNPNKLIVFCGVKFMAESAKILSPDKTILFPSFNAGCSMADMANFKDLKKVKEKHSDAAVVCYINSTTEVKSLCDVVVTSSNALKVIKKLSQNKIIFLPDKNLGEYISEQIPEKEFILWNGFCTIHKKINENSILNLKKEIDDAIILVHPECERNIRNLADFIGSTGEIIDYATSCSAKNYIICTEEGIHYELNKRNPEKNFYFPETSLICPNMKKTTLDDVLNVLKNNCNEITIDEEVRLKALSCLLNMHELAR